MPNHLASEKSPYLLQHKDNPVDWFPWGDEAFQRARKENKLIFLSIGYSTCYWCHVMEKDSFEKEDVAAALKKHFVSIKVDREERPDVDKIYMDAVLAMSGHGGWPMSVFLTPDLKPIYGATFFYHDQFLAVLARIDELWTKVPEQLRENSEKVFDYLKRGNELGGAGDVSNELIENAVSELQHTFDSQFGGFGRAPKFPQAGRVAVLLRAHRRLKSEGALKMATLTLEQMARGGMYDQLGGGFHRYATDERWLVPHFEKMLYDNAQLADVYLEAYQLTADALFLNVARETLDYVLRDMSDASGGFWSAEDAGEVGREGEFYVWKYGELKAQLSAEQLAAVESAYGVTEAGNFEHGFNILAFRGSDWGTKSRSGPLKDANELLLKARNNRPRPHRDDKILTSWNGLMLQALARGYQVTRDARYLTGATRSATFLRERLSRDGKLLHRYRDGEAAQPATLDDYAFFIQGLITLFETDFNPEWFRLAVQLQKNQDDLFWDAAGGGYFFTVATDQSLIVRRKDFPDDATPSGNGVSALNLLRLYDFTADKKYLDRAHTLLRAAAGQMLRYPSAFASTLLAADYQLEGSKQLVALGPKDAPEIRSFIEKVSRSFSPNRSLLVIPDDGARALFPILEGKTKLHGKPTFYVCENHSCKLPTNDVDQAESLALGAPRRM